MRKSAFSIAVIACLSLLMVSVAPAKEMKKLAQTGFQFLKIEPDARGSAIGGAAVPVADDASALFWNPAGIAMVSGIDFGVYQTSWFAGIKQIALAGVLPVGNAGFVGVSVLSMNYGDIPQTTIANNEQGYIEDTYSPSAFAVGLSFARRFTDLLSIGGQVKYAYESLGANTTMQPGDTVAQDVDNTLGAVAFDIGTLYYVGFEDLRISMSIRNFSRQIEYETEGFQMPLTFAIGAAMDIFKFMDLGEGHSLTVSATAIHPRDYSERLHVGAEYWLFNTFALRGGYKFNYDQEGLSAGIGIKKEISGFNVKLDYSFTDMGSYLGSVHRISVGGSL
ncbi:MAG: PorV/PorQ family protein [Candidatus Brocadiales bacterium]|nr:PorV/PorQ family protein [Candidatus Bathyanammoxibius sp.]